MKVNWHVQWSNNKDVWRLGIMIPSQNRILQDIATIAKNNRGGYDVQIHVGYSSNEFPHMPSLELAKQLIEEYLGVTKE